MASSRAAGSGTRARPRLASIQVMRGVAALLVVFAHAADLVEDHPQLGRSHIALYRNVGNVGAIGVDLFFIISGFVMALSVQRLSGPRSALRFLRARWKRIAPAYLVACGMLVVLFAVVGPVPPISWRSLVNSVFFVPVLDRGHYSLPILDVGWSLSFEFTFYAAVAVMVSLGLARRPELLAGLVTLGVVAGAVVGPRTFLFAWATNPIVLEFALGLFAFWLWDRGWLSRGRSLQWAAGAVAAVVLLVEVYVGFGTVDLAKTTLDGSESAQRVLLWGVPLFFVFVALLPVGQDGSGRSRLARLGRTLGDASYSIYLTHLLCFVVLAVSINEHMPATPRLPLADVTLLGSVAAAAAVGVLFYRYVEQPLTSRAQERRPAAAPAVPQPETVADPVAVSVPVTDPVAVSEPVAVSDHTERLVRVGAPTPPLGRPGRHVPRVGVGAHPPVRPSAERAHATPRLPGTLVDAADRPGRHAALPPQPVPAPASR